MIVLYIILAILLLYILFIVVPAMLIYDFAFGRKPCSAPLTERELIGTRYEPYIDILVPADHFVHEQPNTWVSVFARDGVELRGRYFDNHSDKTMLFVHGYCGAPINVQEGMRVKFKPSEADLAAAKECGKNFAELVKARIQAQLDIYQK